jgi:hypothetical protein
MKEIQDGGDPANGRQRERQRSETREHMNKEGRARFGFPHDDDESGEANTGRGTSRVARSGGRLEVGASGYTHLLWDTTR